MIFTIQVQSWTPPQWISITGSIALLNSVNSVTPITLVALYIVQVTIHDLKYYFRFQLVMSLHMIIVTNGLLLLVFLIDCWLTIGIIITFTILIAILIFLQFHINGLNLKIIKFKFKFKFKFKILTIAICAVQIYCLYTLLFFSSLFLLIAILLFKTGVESLIDNIGGGETNHIQNVLIGLTVDTFATGEIQKNRRLPMRFFATDANLVDS